MAFHQLLENACRTDQLHQREIFYRHKHVQSIVGRWLLKETLRSFAKKRVSYEAQKNDGVALPELVKLNFGKFCNQYVDTNTLNQGITMNNFSDDPDQIYILVNDQTVTLNDDKVTLEMVCGNGETIFHEANLINYPNWTTSMLPRCKNAPLAEIHLQTAGGSYLRIDEILFLRK